MKDLFIDHGLDKRTPLVDFKVSGELKLEGRSIPENPVGFYEPILKWVNDAYKLHLKDVVFTIKLEYFNTSSSKILMQLIRLLEKYLDESSVKIIWHYNSIDQDMFESGKDYQSITRIPFEFVEYHEK
ncbi:MAG TPA: DUF1987 domain-containing protein [Bacteroidales bacterium]|nr:DUF1987 domain-containing protein [Bacteroidales bacterium]